MLVKGAMEETTMTVIAIKMIGRLHNGVLQKANEAINKSGYLLRPYFNTKC